MLIKQITVGSYETNCYIVTDETVNECAVIDPGDESNTILDYLEDNGLNCRAILLTHGHFDHIGAVEAIAEETGCPVYINALDINTQYPGYFPLRPADYVKTYADGDRVNVAGLCFEVIGTPGHTPGSVVLVCEDAIFSGDTLFKGTCGRFDLPGGSETEIMHSLAKLCRLNGHYEVYPGHMEFSSLEREKAFNHYCRTAMQAYQL